MTLTIFNGSPRGAKSNTKILMEHLSRGYQDAGGAAPALHFLNRRKQRNAQREAFAQGELILLAFPLYVHAMPGIVKELLEVIAPRDPADGAKLGFVVQQGFPETHQSAWLTPYLERLPRRLGCEPAGIVVKGGVEGIQIMPPWMTKKLYAAFGELGRDLAQQQRFDAERVAALAEPVRIGWGRGMLYRAMSVTGMSNFYWDKKLKEHGAYDRRFARPYDE